MGGCALKMSGVTDEEGPWWLFRNGERDPERSLDTFQPSPRSPFSLSTFVAAWVELGKP